MIKRIFLLILSAALCFPFAAYSADSDYDVSVLGFLDDWNGLTSSKNQYFFLPDETVTVENKELETSPNYSRLYAGTEIYVPVAVYPDGDKDYVRATDKMMKTDNLSISSKVINGKAYVGDIELVEGKKLKIDGLEEGIYARIPLTPDYYSSTSRMMITLRLVLSVQDVTYNDTQVTLRCRIANRTTEIDKNSVYGAKTPTQFKVKKKYNGEATFDFGDNIKYTVRVKGDKTYYMNLSRKDNPDIKEMYPDAFLDFYSFLGDMDSFSATGTLRIPVKRASLAKKDEGESLYAYRVNDNNTLTALGGSGLSYDAETEILTMRTGTLNNYVLSNQPLQKSVAEPDSDILKSGYAAASEASVSQVGESEAAQSSSSAASAAQEDDEGYVPEESAGSADYLGNVNGNVDTGGYINASNKSADNPNTSDTAIVFAFIAMLAGGWLTLAYLCRRKSEATEFGSNG